MCGLLPLALGALLFTCLLGIRAFTSANCLLRVAAIYCMTWSRPSWPPIQHDLFDLAVPPAGLQPVFAATRIFWAALPQATVNKQGCLQLAEGTSFLHVERFMIRACYEALATRLKAYFGNPENRGIVLLGHPGIGKTYFGYLMLHRLALQGQRVVYHQLGLDPLLFCDEGAFQLANPRTELDRSDTWYLVDNVRPMHAQEARTILITAPDRRDVYWDALNWHGFTFLYMPIWSFEELVACRNAMQPGVSTRTSDALLRSLFDRWGGIPRYVLQKLDASFQHFLGHAIAGTTLRILTECERNLNAHPAVSQLIMHLHVEDDFVTTTVRWASTWVAEAVAMKLFQEERDHLRTYLSASAIGADPGGIRDMLWQGLCHRVSPAGDTVRSRATWL